MNKVEVNTRSVHALRVLLSGIFLVAGVNHIAFPGHVAARLTASPVYDKFLFFISADALVVVTGIGLFAGGALLLLNRFTKQVSALLLALLVPITISVQLQGWSTAGPLFKNIAIAGALLFFIMNDFQSVKKKHYEIQG